MSTFSAGGAKLPLAMVDADRLAMLYRSRFGSNSALEQLRHEVMGEVAASLGRTEERIVNSLERLTALALELDGEVKRPRDEVLRDYTRERQRLQQWRWELMVQREALGLRAHGILDRMYPVPPARS